ncbi:hypothetical protein ACEQ8H_003439 [Pleosporales sp. CAS-2024a]
MYNASWIMHLLFLILASWFNPALATSSSQPPTPPSLPKPVDLNTLLDGSLGFFPSTWLASKAILLELHTNNIQKRSIEDTISNRTDKENGAVMATFISGMLWPAFFSIQDNGAAGGLCRALMMSAGSMTSALVGQEAAKNIYDNNSTSSQFEQGVIPGSFIGSVVGGGAGYALARTLCTRLIPEFGPWLKGIEGPKAETARLLTRALPHILTKHLEDLGMDSARAIKFADQLTNTIRLADELTLADAYKFLEQQTVETASELAKVPQAPLDEMARLMEASMIALQQAAPSLPMSPPGMPPPDVVPPPPPPPPPVFPPIPPIAGAPPFPASPLLTIANQMSLANQLAGQIPGAQGVAQDLGQATNRLRDGAQQAHDLMKQNLVGQAQSVFSGASKLVKGLVNGLFGSPPLPGGVVTATSSVVVTATSFVEVTATSLVDIAYATTTTVMDTAYETTTTVTLSVFVTLKATPQGNSKTLRPRHDCRCPLRALHV